MLRNWDKIGALAVFAFVFFLLPVYALAFPGIGGDPLIPCGLQGQDLCNFCHVFQLVQNIYNFIIFVIAPPIAVILVAVGAFFWLSAAGSEGQVTKGRKILISVVWGLVVVYVSWLLVNFVITLVASKPAGSEPVPYNPAHWYDPSSWFNASCSAGITPAP